MTDADRTTHAKARRDRIVKLVFLAVIIAAACGVYVLQTRTPDTFETDWPAGLDEALARAKTTGRNVVVFFIRESPGDVTRRLLKTTLRRPANKQAVKEFIPVGEKVSIAPPDELAKRYKITALPTMLVLDADGNELSRAEGFIGEVAFRQNFLAPGSLKHQLRTDWPPGTDRADEQDLAKALAAARKAGRKGVVALFVRPDLSDASRHMLKTTLRAAVSVNVKAFEPFGAMVTLSSPLAETFAIRRLPTLLLLDAAAGLTPAKRERARREGYVDDASFAAFLAGLKSAP